MSKIVKVLLVKSLPKCLISRNTSLVLLNNQLLHKARLLIFYIL